MWRVGLAFLLGHCCIHGLAQLPASRPWTVVLLGAAALAAAGRSRLLAAFVAGLAWAWLHGAMLLAEDLPTALEGQDLLVGGYIASLPRARAGDPQFDFDVSDAQPGVPSRLRLTWYRASHAPQAGESWQLVVRLKRRNGFANPGGFDFEGRLFREGIGASGYVREDARNRRLAAASRGYAVTRIRAWIAHRIALAVPDHPLLGVLQGLAVGDTQMMTSQQWRVFAATGTTHLMAISGLHIGMIAALAAWLGGAIVRLPRAQARGWSVMHGQVIAGSSAAGLYAVLAGLSVPTQRTLIMLCIYFASRWWRRELPVAHALGLALSVVLLLDPLAPLATGFWLSFGAVATILLTTSARLRRDGPVRTFARVQIAITIGLIPLLIASFGSLSLIAPIANVLAVPLFTLCIVPAVLIGAFAAAVWLPAGQWILSFPAQILEWTWPAFEWLARQPMSLWYFAQPSVPASVALVVGVALLILPGIWPLRIIGVLLCVPAVLNRPAVPAAGDFELSALDVGQGLASVVRTRAHVLVYDAGPAFQTGRDAAELALLPYLHHRGVRRIDTLVVSHADLDHRGGMKSLLATLPVGRILAGPSLADLPAQAVHCRRGQRWIWDGVQFEILHPADVAYERDNDSSCVLRIQAAAGSALLTGDIETAAEAEITDRGLSRADVVVVPHHGSRTSSTPEFVAASIPQFALISAGYRNRWGFPHPHVLERWQAAGARTLTTADSGAIEVTFAAGRALHAREYRLTHRRYWHR